MAVMRMWMSVLSGFLVVVGCGPTINASTQGSGTGGSSDGDSTEGADSASGADDTLVTTGVDESGPSVEPGCFPETGHGEFISEHASGLRVYASCSEADGYFIEHPGDELVATLEGIGAVREASASDLLQVPGFHSVGTGDCCGDLCITLTVQVFDFSLDALLAALAQEFPDAEGQCFGIHLRFTGDDAPRCEQSDPECLPIPVCNGFQDGDGLCCNAPEYDPTAPRVPVGDEALSDGTCSHDGECVLRGAGNHCMSWQSPGFIAPSECFPELSQAFCGCVDGGCHWFDLG